MRLYFGSGIHGRGVQNMGLIVAPSCNDCHGVHNIFPPKDPRSQVYPLNLPETCGKCHSDPKVMAGVKLENGSPIPTDQYEKFARSVHGVALLQKQDIGAPACNSCHGIDPTNATNVMDVADKSKHVDGLVVRRA